MCMISRYNHSRKHTNICFHNSSNSDTCFFPIRFFIMISNIYATIFHGFYEVFLTATCPFYGSTVALMKGLEYIRSWLKKPLGGLCSFRYIGDTLSYDRWCYESEINNYLWLSDSRIRIFPFSCSAGVDLQGCSKAARRSADYSANAGPLYNDYFSPCLSSSCSVSLQEILPGRRRPGSKKAARKKAK